MNEEYYKFPDDCKDVPIPTEPIDIMKGHVFEGTAPELKTETSCCEDGCGCKPEISNFQAIKMLFNFLFVRKTVIEPIIHYDVIEEGQELKEYSGDCKRKNIFQWQKMPDGYEWS